MTFEKRFTDEKILEALEECLKRAVVPASEIAKELDANPRYIKDRLLELKDKNLLSGKIIGSSWCFRPE